MWGWRGLPAGCPVGRARDVAGDPMLWYGMVNHISGLDFLGITRERAPAPPAAAAAGLAAALAAAALALDAIRHAAR